MPIVNNENNKYDLIRVKIIKDEKLPRVLACYIHLQIKTFIAMFGCEQADILRMFCKLQLL